MRVILLALILANVLFFMWSTWVAEPHVEVPARQAEGTSGLRLISELDDALPATEPASENEPATTEPAVIADQELAAADGALAPMLELPESDGNVPPESQPDSQQESKPALQPEAQTASQPASPEEEASILVATEALLPAQADPAEPPAGVSEPAVDIEEPATLTAVLARRDSAASGEPAGLQLAAATTDRRCASLGPFLNLREASEAASSLRARGLAPRQRLSEEQVWVGHWVYLPSYATREEAVEVVERLRAEGVKDIYIEPRGDRENAVSLGLFSDRENAELYAGQVRQYEVRPQITDRYRYGSAYWVDITLAEDQPLDLDEYQRDAVRKVRLEEGNCTEPASAESDPVD